MAKLNRPNGKLFGSSATNIGVFGSGQTSNPTTSTNPDAINTLDDHWEKGWNGAVVSQAPYTAPFVEDMNAVNYVNSYNGAYLLQAGIPEYSKNADYYVDSVCTYNGKIYMCKLDNPAVNPDPDDPDPDAPPINYPPTDTDHWDERVELPDMNDNEVLVGSVGGTGVATDTLNQGDIVASSGGLNIKAGVIINADVKSDAAIEESKLALDHSTDSLNTAISGKAISNLADTTITTPIGDGDVVRYNTGSSKWENSNALTSHLADTNNPHETSMSNLDDANVNDRQTLADGDVMVYDLANTDWVNSPSLKNHLSDTNNPHVTTLANLDDTTITSPQDGDAIIYDYNNSKWINTPLPGGAISTLSDTTITTPTDGELLQYDYANSKWVNSDDIPTRIEVNDIAYVGATPQGHPIVGGGVTMLATDNRTQFLDLSSSSTGYIIKLPSTGVKKGEMFTFYTGGINAANISKALHFQCSDGTLNVYYYNSCFVYRFMAVVDNPTASSHWISSTTVRRYTEIVNTAIEKTNITYTANTRVSYDSSTVALCPGRWLLTLEWTIAKGNSPSAITDPWYISLNYKNHGTAQGFNSRMGGAFGANIPMGSNGNTTIETQTVYFAAMPAYNTTKLIAVNNIETAYIQMSAKSSAAATGAYLCGRLSGYLVYPHTGALT